MMLMSLDEVTITIETEDVIIEVEEIPEITLDTKSSPDIVILASGNVGPTGPPSTVPGPQGPPGPEGPIGPEGPQGKWVAMTQAEYDALSPKDLGTLYVIVE